MAYHCKAESGLQLFARLSSRPPLNGLDDALFSGGPTLEDVIEISGDTSSGKTLLMTQFLTKCLLPKKYNNVIIEGLGISAVFINTDHHFQLLKLVSMMEEYLKKYCHKKTEIESNKGMYLGGRDIEKIIKESLRNLTLLNCHDSVQLVVTFYSLNKLLVANTNISLIILDSASAYYWQDVMNGGIRKMDLYLKTQLRTLQQCIQEFKVTIMYTKQSYFQSKVHNSGCSAKPGLGNVTVKIHLHREETKDQSSSFHVSIMTNNKNKLLKYMVTPFGLHWVNC